MRIGHLGRDPSWKTCVSQLSGALPDAELLRLSRPKPLPNPPLDVVFVEFSGGESRDAIVALRSADIALPIVAIVAENDISAALRAMQAGASAYVSTPIHAEDLTETIERALARARNEQDALWARAEHAARASKLVGVSPAMATIRAQIQNIAGVDAATVLITGESGTGKDVVATEIHAAGKRADRPMMAIDCAAIPDTLIESHLFGHEKGAFTDAKQLKRGLFELGRGGTIFLDEIGELPLTTQSKLLRALESRSFRRVGGTDDLSLDAALIAATNRDLLAESQEGRFRADLYYRLNVVRIHVPALRDRPHDVEPLTSHFVSVFNSRLGRRFRGADTFTLHAMRTHSWPGNVRELRNVIERAMILNPSEEHIRIVDLPPELIERDAEPMSVSGEQLLASGGDSGRSSEDVYVLPRDGVDIVLLERAFVEQAMQRAHGNQTHAAALLRISRFAMRHRLEKHGLEHLAHKKRGRPPKEKPGGT